jgi:putative NIF3 family GTP cyclohydrolase 1 type 2
VTSNSASSTVIDGRTVDLLLNRAFGDQRSVARFEGLCIGEPTTLVTGAVACYAPTVEILTRAAESGRNLVIAREHPFFLHGGINHAYVSEGLLTDDPVLALGPGGTDRDLIRMEGFTGDPVVEAKRALIIDSGITVFRHGAAWDQFRPAAQSAALARALGMPVAAEQEHSRRRGVVCDLPAPTPLLALARTARTALGSTAPRIVGDAEAVATRVGVIAGETDPVSSLAELLADPSVDCIVAGAGGILDEVDGGIAYFLDAAADRPISMLTVGYGPSHEPGVREMTEAIRAAVPSLDIEYWASGDPGWVPSPASASATIEGAARA